MGRAIAAVSGSILMLLLWGAGGGGGGGGGQGLALVSTLQSWRVQFGARRQKPSLLKPLIFCAAKPNPKP